MTTNTKRTGVNLPSTRFFPDKDPKQLSLELNKSYTDIAIQVNNKTSGIYSSSVTSSGEVWEINGEKKFTLRQVIFFHSAGSFPHEALFDKITKSYGTFADSAGTWYPLLHTSIMALDEQTTYSIGANTITIVQGAGAGIPAIVNGHLVFEWIPL